jgi:hypothetical protein
MIKECHKSLFNFYQTCKIPSVQQPLVYLPLLSINKPWPFGWPSLKFPIHLPVIKYTIPCPYLLSLTKLPSYFCQLFLCNLTKVKSGVSSWLANPTISGSPLY